MPGSRQSVRVHIFNQTYSLLAEDGDAREVEEIAHEIDELMTEIAGRVSSGDTTRIAVLACLHLADKLRSAERQLRLYEDRSDQIARVLEAALVESPAEKAPNGDASLHS